MKLSKIQQEVIDLMRDGWELGQSKGFHESTWLQQGGCGKGGPTKKISSATLTALYDRGLIVKNEHKYPRTTYKLKGE